MTTLLDKTNNTFDLRQELLGLLSDAQIPTLRVDATWSRAGVILRAAGGFRSWPVQQLFNKVEAMSAKSAKPEEPGTRWEILFLLNEMSPCAFPKP